LGNVKLLPVEDDRKSMMELGQLLVKCQKCGALYPSEIIVDFEAIQKHLDRPGDVTTTCPFCEHQNVSSPRNMTYTMMV